MVAETDLARPEDDGDAAAAPPKGVSKLLGKLGKLGKLAKKGAKFIPAGGAAAARHHRASRSPTTSSRSRRAIVEVDGAPPLLDDAVIALTALSNVLQTVAASPDPEDAIKEQGGLAELTGAVANQAAILPDPLDDWLAGIAGDTTGITERGGGLRSSTPSGAPTCCRSARRRSPAAIPSTRPAPSTSTPPTSPGVFGPGGLIDAFTNDHLLPYVDTAARPWTLARRPRPRRRRARRARARAPHPRRALPRRRRPDHDLHARAEGPLAQRRRASRSTSTARASPTSTTPPARSR